MYPLAISLVLIFMIITGAARSVAVKLFYQLGFQSPLFVTLLYLFGQSLSLIFYFVSVQVKRAKHPKELGDDEYIYNDYQVYELNRNEGHLLELQENVFDPTLMLSDSVYQSMVLDIVSSSEDEEELTKEMIDNKQENAARADNVGGVPSVKRRRRGSKTGLTEKSTKAATWVHSIPWYLKPMLPGFFNLCNSAMRWASLIYISASVAEILISGLELVLSVFASRIVRKRMISRSRWYGVGIVFVGLMLVGVSHVLTSQGKYSTTAESFMGLVLIVGQCIMSVAQDMAEELFMHEADFPATLLLGMEGLFGLLFGLILYLPLAPIFGEDTTETWDTLTSSLFKTGYAIGLTLLFTVTAIFNIMATGVTSSMTRNMWKNLRTALVWIFSLLIYYCSGDKALGEPWLIPESLYILGGFIVILSGIYLYYKQGSTKLVPSGPMPVAMPAERNVTASAD